MFQYLGKRIGTFLTQLGQITLLAGHACRHIVLRPHVGQVFEQMYRLGVKSLPITTVTALFIGLAFALQVVQELRVQ